MSGERTFAVNDQVTWRTSPNALAFTGCKVLELGVDEAGQPAALIEVMGREVAALQADLHHE